MIIEMPALNRSNSAARRDKHYIKQLTGVDCTRQDGYAFLGAFVNHGATVEVDEGAWFFEFAEDRSGSGHLYGRDITLYQVRNGELAKVNEWRLDGKDGWALKVRDEIAAILAAAKDDSDPALLEAEREQLLARVREIDELLRGRAA